MCGRREKHVTPQQNTRRKSQRTRQSRADSWRYVIKQAVNRKSLVDLRCVMRLKRKGDEEICRSCARLFRRASVRRKTPLYPLMRLTDVPKTRWNLEVKETEREKGRERQNEEQDRRKRTLVFSCNIIHSIRALLASEVAIVVLIALDFTCSGVLIALAMTICARVSLTKNIQLTSFY